MNWKDKNAKARASKTTIIETADNFLPKLMTEHFKPSAYGYVRDKFNYPERFKSFSSLEKYKSKE